MVPAVDIARQVPCLRWGLFPLPCPDSPEPLRRVTGLPRIPSESDVLRVGGQRGPGRQSTRRDWTAAGPVTMSDQTGQRTRPPVG